MCRRTPYPVPWLSVVLPSTITVSITVDTTRSIPRSFYLSVYLIVAPCLFGPWIKQWKQSKVEAKNGGGDLNHRPGGGISTIGNMLTFTPWIAVVVEHNSHTACSIWQGRRDKSPYRQVKQTKRTTPFYDRCLHQTGAVTVVLASRWALRSCPKMRQSSHAETDT